MTPREKTMMAVLRQVRIAMTDEEEEEMEVVVEVAVVPT